MSWKGREKSLRGPVLVQAEPGKMKPEGMVRMHVPAYLSPWPPRRPTRERAYFKLLRSAVEMDSVCGYFTKPCLLGLI